MEASGAPFPQPLGVGRPRESGRHRVGFGLHVGGVVARRAARAGHDFGTAGVEVPQQAFRELAADGLGARRVVGHQPADIQGDVGQEFALQRGPLLPRHSHSMVAGGLPVMS